MTPAQIVTASRRKTNAESDSFYSDEELYGLIDEAILDLLGTEYALESVDTSITTVSGTRTYSVPASTIAIKRVEWNGETLRKIDGFKVDDELTADNPDSTATGTPRYWFEFADLIYLRPVPSSAATLKVFRSKTPTPITTSTQTIEIPVHWHRGITNYLAWAQAIKDEDFATADRYDKKWQKVVKDFRNWAKRRKVAGGFRTVKLEEIHL